MMASEAQLLVNKVHNPAAAAAHAVTVLDVLHEHAALWLAQSTSWLG